MGLDGVEIIMECEDEFGIRIPDVDASKMVTVADLYALICRLRGQIPPGDASTASGAIGEALSEVGIERGTPDPAARLADVVPERLRPAFWASLRRRMGNKLPDLVGPPAARAVGIGWVALCTILSPLAIGPAGIIVGFLLGLATVSLFTSRLRRLHPQFPPRFTTFRDLVPAPMDGLEIWRALVTILCGQLALRPEEVKMESRFNEDLHVG